MSLIDEYLDTFLSVGTRPSDKLKQFDAGMRYLNADIPLVLRMSASVVSAYKSIELGRVDLSTSVYGEISKFKALEVNEIFPYPSALLRGIRPRLTSLF